MNASLTKEQIKAGYIVAGAADGLQILLAPLFMEGFASPFNDLLDIAVGIALTNIIGWHWVFVPTFCGEEMPILDELPTWTLAVAYAVHDRPALPNG